MPTVVDIDARKLIAGDTERRQARSAMDELSSTTFEHWVATPSSGVDVRLPRELSVLLTNILETIARGGTVTVGSMPEDVTTTTAAELLGISRPTLMKMIAKGEIQSHKVGTHTRIKSAHVFDVRRARLERQRKAFEELRDLEDAD